MHFYSLKYEFIDKFNFSTYNEFLFVDIQIRQQIIYSPNV